MKFNATTVDLGPWSEKSINELLTACRSMTPGDRVAVISERFLDTPYVEATLTGGDEAEEQLVINLSGVDCFTFLDYVEALRLSCTFDEFLLTLPKVRYRAGRPDFLTRNHFFTDWIVQNQPNITEATREVGGTFVQTVKKQLNRKDDGTRFLPRIPVICRDISYLPTQAVAESVHRLRNGDYLGIFSPLNGLDVSHTGILIKTTGGLVLRHASSLQKYRRVIDQELTDYLIGHEGVVILRPR